MGVDQGELHVARNPRYNPISQLARQVKAPTRDRCRFLLTGVVGNGKSSELNHLAAQLTADRLVISFDLWAHLEGQAGDPKAIDHLQIWELLGLIGLAIYTGATERFGHQWQKDEPKVLEKSLSVLREADAPGAGGEIDLVALVRGMSVVAGGLVGGSVGVLAASVVGGATVEAGRGVLGALASASEWNWKVGLADSKRRSDQEGEVKAVLYPGAARRERVVQ